MKRTDFLKLTAVAVFSFGGVIYAQQELPKHPKVEGDGKNLVVQLCDGETSTTVAGVPANGKMTPEQAQAVSNELMSKWYAKTDPGKAAAWKQEELRALQTPKRQPQKSGVPQTKAEAEQAADFNDRDHATWKRELDQEISLGDKIFHSDKEIGSTNGVSCAMCHPNAANTHPETYPKFQIQLRRVALLRDMVNWCIENPSRGKKLDADDPKMRAIEAYIMSQRKGVAMAAGKH